MLNELVRTLTTEQIKELARHDIPPPRVSNWKSGARRPTMAQAKVLALVTGTSFQELADELAEMDATPDQRTFFRTMTTAVIAIMSSIFLFSLPTESQASARVYSASAVQAHAVSQTANLYIVRSF